MEQELAEQVNTIERALGERMIDHAQVIVRSWLNELGENNPYEESLRNICARYHQLMTKWLNSDDSETAMDLNDVTGEMFQLVDAVLVDISLKRGISPDMHGFNQDSPQSVMNYFANCVKISKEDLDWLRSISDDTDKGGLALLGTGALMNNLRANFNQPAMMMLIDAMQAKNDYVADQCMAYVCSLLIHYDGRIDYFPEIQLAFYDSITNSESLGERVFEILCALASVSRAKWLNMYMEGMASSSSLPPSLLDLLEMTGTKNDQDAIHTWLPDSEKEYMEGLMQALPETWLYDIVVKDNEARERRMACMYLMAGKMDLAWDYPDVAEEYLIGRIRNHSYEEADYMNYGHLMMLKGDKMMAYEYYKQARTRCRSAKRFLEMFRPDRRALIDHGVPLEQVYLMEDLMLNN